MIRNRVVAATLTCALSASFVLSPVAALAAGSDELQAQLDDANAQLATMYAQAEELSEKVNETQYQLDTTKAEIEVKQAELAEAQDVLADQTTSDYKTGGSNWLSIIFGASSLEEVISNFTALTKVMNAEAENIQKVKDLQAELDAKEAEQEQLLSEQKSEQAELDNAVAESEAYVSSLSVELQNAIAEEKAAAEEAARKAAEEEAAAAAAAAAEAQQTEETANTDTNTNTNTDSGNTSNNTANNGGSVSGGDRSAIVAAAYSKVGNASYVYGAGGPNAFDCSGFVSWCYAQAGYSAPHSSGAYTSWAQTSSPQPGDVCWKPGHVGIYIGGGMMIDAANPYLGIRKVSCAEDGIVAYYTR